MSVASVSVSASASVSGVFCGSGGVEDILVGRCGFATFFCFTGDGDVVIIWLREVLSNLMEVGFR